MREAVVVWGAGAMGGTVGAHLVRAGHAVRFVDEVPEHVAAIREGLRITGPIAELRVAAPASQPGEVEGPLHTVLLAVKAHHTERAVRQIAPLLAGDGVVVSVQNGLNERAIARAVGAERTFGCFVNFGADYLEPGLIHWGGRGAVVVGEVDGRRTARARRIHRLFTDFDARAVLSDNVMGYLWSKLAYAAMLFATALADDSIADALARPGTRDVFTGLAREVVSVALEAGIRLESFDGFDPGAFAPGPGARRRGGRWTGWWSTTGGRPRRTAGSGGTWRCGAGRRRWTRSSARWSRPHGGSASPRRGWSGSSGWSTRSRRERATGPSPTWRS